MVRTLQKKRKASPDRKKAFTVDESCYRFRQITKHIEDLKILSLEGLRERYQELLGKEPPATQDMNWLFHCCSYKFQMSNYWDLEVHDSVKERFQWWLTNEPRDVLLQKDYQKFELEEIEKLCREHAIPYVKPKNRAQREELIKQLAFAVVGIHEIYGAETPKKVVEAGEPKRKRRPRGVGDGLPETIAELLELKKEADSELSKRIRRKLRSIDKDWRKNHGK